MLETLFNWLIEQQLLISILVVSLLILERYSLKWLSANFVYKLWLLIPISLVLTNLPAHLKPLQSTAISKMLITSEQTLVADFSVSWALMYAVVFSLLAAIAAVSHRRFIKQLRLTRLESCEFVGTYSDIKILQSDTIDTPMVIGLLHTQLVLPTGYIHKTDSASLAMIIEHEQVHIKRADNLLNMMQLTITLAFWFNPLAWLGYMSFRRLQELSCDETVLKNKSTQQRILYSKALINCVANTRASLMAYSHYGDKNTMLQRLKQIKHTGNSSLVAKGAILIFAAGMLSSFATAKQPEAKNEKHSISPIMRIEPLYPTQAAEQGISGSVVLKYDISPTGKTQNVSVVSATPENVFNKEAKRALKKWEYKPSDSGFKNVLVQLDFAIDDNYKSRDLVEKITVASK
ncbi:MULTISPECIES: TonB family protein [unclassified Pseudoalteromonas]|uniref:M56 family metallopeptidase n=1 Tax=unclassified Pseudoalteromonas TaxID=194690 RepID=UPI000C071776|nr:MULTISPECIES: TonB family protein [unclassified Pseudoalteromonas]MDP2633419.1 TonB family protein [Pseudoalteromonas sp. 1_MG-2023]PHN90555.1 energy transducer TonB [Pseudoalteromonas sp. 3D05]